MSDIIPAAAKVTAGPSRIRLSAATANPLVGIPEGDVEGTLTNAQSTQSGAHMILRESDGAWLRQKFFRACARVRRPVEMFNSSDGKNFSMFRIQTFRNQRFSRFRCSELQRFGREGSEVQSASGSESLNFSTRGHGVPELSEPRCVALRW